MFFKPAVMVEARLKFHCKRQQGLWVKGAGSHLSDLIAPNVWTSNRATQCLLIVMLHISIYTTTDIYNVYGILGKNEIFLSLRYLQVEMLDSLLGHK